MYKQKGRNSGNNVAERNKNDYQLGRQRITEELPAVIAKNGTDMTNTF